MALAINDTAPDFEAVAMPERANVAMRLTERAPRLAGRVHRDEALASLPPLAAYSAHVQVFRSQANVEQSASASRPGLARTDTFD